MERDRDRASGCSLQTTERDPTPGKNMAKDTSGYVGPAGSRCLVSS